jgi:hypothetical protein
MLLGTDPLEDDAGAAEAVGADEAVGAGPGEEA